MWIINDPNDPKIIKHVTTTNFLKYEVSKVREPLAALLGGGIVRVNGVRWAFHRKVAVQMFSKALVREGTLIAVKKTRQLVDILDEKLAGGE